MPLLGSHCSGMGCLGDDTTSIASDVTSLLAPLAQAGGNVITASGLPSGATYAVNPSTGVVTQVLPYGVAATQSTSSSTMLIVLAVGVVVVFAMMQRRGQG